jgi:signal transduction histidine kinase
MLRITNRVAGPIFIMRRQIVDLNQGEDGHPLKFRNDDYWDSLAGDFNSLRDELLQLRTENQALRSATAAASSSASEAVDIEMNEPVAAS